MFVQHPSGVDTLALVEAVEKLTAATSLEDVSAIVRSAARRILGADGISFVLREGDLCHYFDEDAIGPLWKGQRFPAETCISGWAMINRETAVVPDILTDPRIPQAAYAVTFVKSLIMTPVRRHDPLGAIGAYWATSREPSEAEIKALETLARAAAASIANALLTASLKDAEARLAVALEAGRLGSWTLDASTGRFYASPSCKSILGYAPDEAMSYDDLIGAMHDEDRERVAEAVDAAAERGEPLDLECRIFTRTGSLRWMALHGRLAPDGDTSRPPVLVGVGQDVTARRQAQPAGLDSLREFRNALGEAVAQNAIAYRQRALS
jgi:PAS domain S-box-containing protein